MAPNRLKPGNMQSARSYNRQGHEALYVKLNDADTQGGRKGPAIFSFDKLIFQVSGGVEFVDPGVVSLLKAESNYTHIIETNGRTLFLSKTLKQCARIFPPNFLRVHQSYLVNPAYMISYDRKAGHLLLEDERTIPVSRSGKSVMQSFLAAQACH